MRLLFPPAHDLSFQGRITVFIPFQAKINLHFIYKFSSYVTENTAGVLWRDQRIKDVRGGGPNVYRKNDMKYKHKVNFTLDHPLRVQRGATDISLRFL